MDQRTVVVTGGSSGIGRAVAARFVADGADVVITGRRPDALRAAAGDLGARGVVCDAADPEAVERALGALPHRIDVLVNNAGGNTDLARPEAHGLCQVAASWQANLAGNLLSAVLTTMAVSDRLAPGGRVILIGSIAADRGSRGGRHGAGKGGPPPGDGHPC